MVINIPIILCMSMMLTAIALPNICYHCTNDPQYEGELIYAYDPACGDLHYNGTRTNTDSTYDRCHTEIWNTGYISRGTFYGEFFEDGDCASYTSHVYCICTSAALCNTGTYCEQCDFPFTTLNTTTATTTATTASSTNSISTATSGESTTPPTEALSCYSCYDCPEVDANTHVVQNPSIASCVTTILLDVESRTVFRGDTHEDYEDGECRQYGGSLSCWCQSTLCNGQIVAKLLDLQRATQEEANILPYNTH
ncbi:unnamed protein product [Meganyctiphanes norvegica]|uniref:Uncharacterized protein n=1 Tax=Meganyctiphanes norvegica TaxID=48144 RepID=A0AAV2R775_MEGNR